ncbi:MAG: hypothetical protein GVY17_13365 [Cyanobacteria bacterium]|jgi:hypothetical protein|nr:hypothetical protein [Cyanobacteria bacterium GSL.Bin21]
MKIPLVSVIAIASLSSPILPSDAQPAELTPSSAQAQEVFRCDLSSQPPQTIIIKNDDNATPRPLIHWSAQYFQSDQEALSLCQEVSQQLQQFYEAGELTHLSLVAGAVDSEAVVCLERESGLGCERDRVLFTLDTDRNPEVVLYELIAAEFKPPRTRGDFPTRLDFSFFDWL